MKFVLLSFALSLFPLLVASQSYNSLWKSEQKFESDGQPQSAYKIAKTILKKAIKEGNLGQAMSARLCAAGLHQEWAPDSFFTDIAELETLRAQEKQPEAKAVYASILAEVYESNRQRSQARQQRLDSEDRREWTQEQYDSAAMKNWQLSLADIEVLARAKSKDWLPFVTQSSHSDYFRHDLLHILWQRVHNRKRSDWEEGADVLMKQGEDIRSLYRRQGNREAELLIALDLIDLFCIKNPSKSELPLLKNLKDEFSDLPLCAEVYLRLIRASAIGSEKDQYCQEALQRYSRYERIGAVRKELNNIRQPQVFWDGKDVCYPGKTYTWQLRTKNTSAVELTIYRLKDNFKEADIKNSKLSAGDYFRQNATLVQTLHPTIHQGAPYQEVKDSLQWTAPEVGRYAILFTASTNEAETMKKNLNDHYQTILVTSLQTMTRFFNESNVEVIVVDAESGQPHKGASVNLYNEDYRTDKRTLIGTQKTNNEGRAIFSQLSKEQQRRVVVTAVYGKDSFYPEEMLWNGGQPLSHDRNSMNLRLYTDRAIYRPGQTVHLSGISYTQQHWDAKVFTGQSCELILRDANRKEVSRQTAPIDAMGVITADFVLPEGGLPGLYTIQSGGKGISFRVEEYKRPTFEVKMDEAPALQWPQDSITLSGKALAYSGVPIRSGRVTGTYQFTYPYFWWYRHDDSPILPVDTVQTDDQGSFSVRVPLKKIPSDALRHGLVLRLNVEVLSAAGETREGVLSVHLCTTPLRLNITMQEQQDKDRLQAPTFSLLTSTGKPTEGTITWTILPVSDPSATPLASGSVVGGTAADASSLVTALRDLPSGDYELHAKAQAGNDTASATARFFLFSMADTRPPRTVEDWLYAPSDTFDLEHPARIQFGSSFEDVALYYSLVGKEGCIRDELIPISNELRTLEIPYKPEYGDGVTVHLAFVKGGVCYSKNQSLKLALPESQLQWKWTSFRDRLHPGDHETWTLRLTHADGSPASANLMATIYDASLDQIVPHSWQFLINRYHQLFYLPWQSQSLFNKGNVHENLYFPMKDYSYPSLVFDTFNDQWMRGLSFDYLPLLGSTRMMKANRALSAELSEAPRARLQAESADMEDEVAVSYGTNITQASSKAPSDVVSAATSSLRTNFNETAAFLPRLHTNPATGEVTLSFTLPESLTTWQMLGIAHTTDLQVANIQAQAIARKELMARLYLPRFLRAGDRSSIRAAVQNLTERPVNGRALLEVFNPETEKLILKKEVPFQAAANGESILAFDYTPTEDVPVVAVRLTAGNKSFSDGEQRYLAILSSKEYVTESVEIRADSIGTFSTDLTSLTNYQAPSATQRRLTVEYTTHPIWNVVQALPALREPQYNDVLSLTSVFYANALAAHIATTTPRLRDIITLWKQQASSVAGGTATSKSPLARDEDLKNLLLAETPWLRDADSDTERRAQLADLFDENLLKSRLDNTLNRLQQRQEADGGFSWFPGMRSSELMTRLVAIELTHLRSLTDNFSTLSSSNRQQADNLLQQAVSFIAKENSRMIKEMKKAEAEGATINTGALMHLDYVYITQRAGVRLTKAQQADVRYLLDHLKGSVAGMSNDERAMAAIVLKGDGRTNDASLYFNSMKEHLTTTSDHGTFFDYAGGSFTPTSHKVIVHSAAMEAVRELAPNDKALNSGLRRWLLQQKRTQMWESSICTTNAIYVLLQGSAATADLQSTATDKLTLNYGQRKVAVVPDNASRRPVAGKTAASNSASPAALGYLRATYTDGAAPNSITVQRNSPTEAWGAVYAQCLIPVTDATAHASGLNIRREFSSTAPRLGDKLTTRYVITADRDYEYVCLRADRPAAAEPAEQVSTYHYQGGLGYYRAVHDAHTDYFFDSLPKGTYVLEETSFIDRTGHYTSGLCRLQCLYAPEFNAHTNAVELKIEQK